MNSLEIAVYSFWVNSIAGHLNNAMPRTGFLSLFLSCPEVNNNPLGSKLNLDRKDAIANLLGGIPPHQDGNRLLTKFPPPPPQIQ